MRASRRAEKPRLSGSPTVRKSSASATPVRQSASAAMHDACMIFTAEFPRGGRTRAAEEELNPADNLRSESSLTLTSPQWPLLPFAFKHPSVVRSSMSLVGHLDSTP